LTRCCGAQGGLGAQAVPISSNKVDRPPTYRHRERIVLNFQDLKGRDEEHGAKIHLPHILTEARSAAADGCPLSVQLARKSRTLVRRAEVCYLLNKRFAKPPPESQHLIFARLPQLRAKSGIKNRFEIRLNIPVPLRTFSIDRSPLHLRTRLKFLAYLLLSTSRSAISISPLAGTGYAFSG
jgi:hypothetical protein